MTRVLPDWLDAFFFYTSESECPDSYLRWSALHTISAALERRVWTEWVYHKFYPNLYILLIGPPGVTHKNAAIRFSRRFLRATGVPTASDSITKEAFIQQMKRRGRDAQAIAAMPNEFPSFVGPSGPNMIGFLTDIYDSDDNWEYTTKGGGSDIVERPYLTLLGGAVPTWIADEFGSKFMEYGFSARTLLIFETEPRFRKARVTITDEMHRTADLMVEDLLRIMEMKGEFKWTPEAEQWWDHWYEIQLPALELDYRLQGYLGRKPTHLLKVSMVISAIESDELLLTEKHFASALRYLSDLEPQMERALQATGANPLSSHLERIANDIVSHSGMSLADLVRRNTHALKRAELDEQISNLIDMGVIRSERRAGKLWYVPLL
jgi:hypothetical protein